MEYLTSKYRTHTCADLRLIDVDKKVTLSGWIQSKRDHGGIVFIDLRDNYGITQVVFSGALVSAVQEIRIESVITVKGKVVARANELVNPKLSTGEVEISAESLIVLSNADVLPFLVAEDDNAPETTCLKYRFLELRREKLHKNILLRSKVIAAIREVMHSLGFIEFQTPILTSSSPEGARDFLVPSRIHPGKFFALPQAPQQFKQLLMVAGFDRYFQIAPCFRDEDPRADRSPGEFYQCDLEMSFVEQEDVFKACEQLFYKVFTRFTEWKVTEIPFPRFKYDQSLAWFGTDKPDLRNPLRIECVDRIFRETSFKVFKQELSEGNAIFALKIDPPATPSRKYFDDTVEDFKKASGRGLAYLIFENGAVKGTIAKFVSEQEVAEIRNQLGAKDGSVVFLAAGPKKKAFLTHVGNLRVKFGEDFKLAETDAFRFCWITDYPLYERDDLTGEIVFSHNPFSMPQGGMEALLNKDPLDIYAFQYDVVCNGNELSSGAIRNHSPEIMYKAFEIAGYSKEETDEKFGGMIRAFKFGAPPHGGMAPGIDRIVMLLAQETAIRDVIAFPLAQTVEDLLMGAPSAVKPRQLHDLHIEIKLPDWAKQ